MDQHYQQFIRAGCRSNFNSSAYLAAIENSMIDHRGHINIMPLVVIALAR